MNVLIVRLGALGDIVHTVPAAAALRRAHPDARIDWVVDARHASFVRLVDGIDRVVPLERPTVAAWIQLVQMLRPARYDVALDFQGLMKSAIIARASGARRVVGFSIWHLREKGARPFYSDVDDGAHVAHVIQKNLNLLSLVGVETTAIEFPFAALAVAGAGAGQARGRGAADCADQSGSGVAEQALAGLAIRRGRGVPQGGARARSVRAVGTRRAVARPGGGGRVGGRREGRPGHHDRRSARALARGVADGLGRHRPAPHRRRRRHPDRGDLRPHRSRPQWTMGRQTMWWCRAMAPATVTISANAVSASWCLSDVTVAEVTAAIQHRLANAPPIAQSTGSRSQEHHRRSGDQEA